MENGNEYTKKLFVRLQTNGYIAIDEDYLWDGCDPPELDPDIELTPVPLSKLVQLVADLNLHDPEKDDIERLKKLLSELNTSTEIIEAAIKTIESKFP